MAMQRRMLGAGLHRCNFPFMAESYVLHLGRASLRNIWEHGRRDNAYYEWSEDQHDPHYHGNADGDQCLEMVQDLFEREGENSTPEAFAHSLRNGPQLAVPPLEKPRGTRA